MTLRAATVASTTATVLLAAGAASAHARLLASDPAAGAAVPAPEALSLTFDERLTSAFSGVDLSIRDGTKLPLAGHVSPDGKTLVGIPHAPLTAGTYVVKWHAVSSGDGHRVTGSFAFTVK